ncbi:MAG: type IV pilus modification protein PilV [Luteimonas sp.]
MIARKCFPRSFRRKAASGFSMIEVLVALLVLALGLLGFALLQTMNLRYTQSADYRTHATNLAYELLDQMRVNKLSVADYESASFLDAATVGSDCERPTGVEVDVATVVARWQCQVVRTLGEDSSVDVQFNHTSGLVTIVMSWGDRVVTDPMTSFELETYL